MDVGLGCDRGRQRNLLPLTGDASQRKAAHTEMERRRASAFSFLKSGGAKIPNPALGKGGRCLLQPNRKVGHAPALRHTNTGPATKDTPPNKQAPPVVGGAPQHLHDSWSVLFHLD